MSRRFFLFLISRFFSFEPGRLCRHPSIRTLLLGELFARCKLGVLHFSRCCYLRIDLGSHPWDESWARTWAQSPELGG